MNKRRWLAVAGPMAAVVVILVVVAGVNGCRKREPWNVLIITMDTTRADHLRCYGYDRIETPHLNELARQGTLFERGYSHIPLTLPAHTSIFTGMPPKVHGVIDNGSYRVPDKLTTLAEILKGRGYQTAAFISAAVLKSSFNLNQGFDHWDEEGITAQEQGVMLVADRKGDQTTDAALAWLGDHYQAPFFMWVHYYDPHAAYEPPEPFKGEYIHIPYDGEIAFMDQQIGRLLKSLDDHGLRGRTIVAAIGDHGEGLGDHKEPTHAVFIYQATIHVPFLMRVPGGGPRAGRRLKTVVSLMDVMPTVLDYLGMPAPAQVIGESLRPFMDNDPEPESVRYAFAEAPYTFLHYGWSPLFALAGPRYKYIKAPRPEFYDLTEDPGELQNLLEGDSQGIGGPARSSLSLLRSILDSTDKKWTAMAIEGEDANLSFEEQQAIMALGYIAGGAHVDVEKAAGKDPKDFADLLEVLQRERQSIEKQDFAAALECADTVLARDPENPQALSNRAYALFGVGRAQEALDAYEHMFEVLEHETFSSRLDMAFIHMQLAQESFQSDKEKWKAENMQAIESFEKSIELRKPYPNREAHYYIGRIYLDLGDKIQEERILYYGKAHAEFHDESLQDRDLGYVGKALLYEREGRLEFAEAEFKKAAQLIKEKEEEEKDKGGHGSTYSTVYWTEWAQYLGRRGRHREEVDFLEKAMEKDKEIVNRPGFQQILNQARQNMEKGDAGGN